MIPLAHVTKGLYLAVRGTSEYIVNIDGVYPALRIIRVIDAISFEESNKVTSTQDSVKIAKEIENNINKYSFFTLKERSIATNPIEPMQNSIEWTPEEMDKWIEQGKIMRYGEMITNLSYQRGLTVSEAIKLYEKIKSQADEKGITFT